MTSLFEATVTSTAPLTVLVDGADDDAVVDYAPPGATWSVSERVVCAMVSRKIVVLARLL